MTSYVFIDARVGDVDSILDGLVPDTGITTVILDAGQDGLSQIAYALAGITDLAAVHILSHGSAGTLYLGNSVITSDALADYASQLQTLGASLSANGDLLLYGCDVAAGVAGQTFINTLARYTGADVAASTDFTGNAALNGDWNLEAATGTIEAPAIAAQGFAGLLAPAIDLATIAAGTGGFVIHGQDAGDESGWSVASAGDINGDGFDDLIIGARHGDAAGNAKSNAGDSYVVFGKAGGFGASIDLTTIAAGTGGFVIYGQDAGDLSGESVASAGDINGDGFDDLIIGASGGYAAGNAKSRAGDSYVVFGKSGGFGVNIDLANIAAGVGGFVIHGQDALDRSGFSVASAGDINGDGFDDIIIGAKYGAAAGNAKNDAGDSYVIFGRDFSGVVTHQGGNGADSLTGSAGADILIGGRGNDTLNGGAGGADVMRGGAGDDVLIIAGVNFQDLDGGSGVDTLRLSGAGQTLDLATIGGGKLSGIEVIDLSGSGNSTLSLTARSLLNLSDSSNTLRVDGNAGDVVVLAPGDAAWVRGATAGGYTTYSQGQATLQVANAVSVSIIVAPVDLTSIAAGSGGFVIHGQDAGDRSGFSVASAGDINGDGFDDLIVGAPMGDAAGNAKSSAGDSYVVFGKAGGFGASIDLATIAAGTGGFVIRGQDANDQSGWSVASAGDINGDGFDDLIIGARGGDAAGNPKNYAGDSYVVFGKAGGFGASIDLAAIAAGTGGFVIHGQDALDQSGWWVASAGDINGDGFDDLLIGARGGDAAGNAKSSAGDSYVVFGKAGGFGASIDLTTIAAGTGGFVVYGQDAGDYSGISVASAGDLNGDGFDDLIIGAPIGDAADNAKSSAGDSYVVFGKASGFGASIDLTSIAAGAGGFVIHGQDVGDRSGWSAASAGDINGDGFDDLIIGAYRGDAAGNAKSSAGDSYVVFGKAGGFGASIDLATIAAGTGGFVIYGQDADDQTGIAVAAAGDVNGDGLDDLIIGARDGDAAGNAKSRAGDSYVVFGKVGGFGASIDLTNIAAGTGGIVIHGQDADDFSGHSVASAGDINGDGFDDLIIGAFLGDAAGNAKDEAGDSYVIFGRDFSGVVTHQGGNGADSLTGTAGADILIGGRGNDTLDGAGGADAMRGGAGDDLLIIANLNVQDIDGGSGVDTLRLSGAGQTLNLATIGGSKLSGIEAIDLSGNGNNTLALNARSLLNLSDSSNTLRVDGNAGDVVKLAAGDGSGWVQGVSAGAYTPYTNGQAILQVANGVTVVTVGGSGADHDYNGDGKSDILWRNDNGQVAVWLMDGHTLDTGQTVSTPVSADWTIQDGAGDYNADGKSDILWRNDNGQVVVWLMDGGTIASSQTVSTPVTADWKIQDGEGDYNGDGKSDILWRNDNGQVVVWLMDGATLATSQTVSTPVTPDWKIQDGSGDYNGDGNSDILWRNDNGQVAVWLMDGGNLTAGQTVSAPVSVDWKIQDGAGDYNGDGNSDILWRNDNGNVAVWDMNGVDIIGSAEVGTASLDWTVV